MEKTNTLSDLKDACRRIMLQHEAYTVAAELLSRLEEDERVKPYIKSITNQPKIKMPWTGTLKQYIKDSPKRKRK